MPPEMMLSAGRPITNVRMSAAAAMVLARRASPAVTVHGTNTSTPPSISTTPVKYRNHCPAPICSNNLTH